MQGRGVADAHKGLRTAQAWATGRPGGGRRSTPTRGGVNPLPTTAPGKEKLFQHHWKILTLERKLAAEISRPKK